MLSVNDLSMQFGSSVLFDFLPQAVITNGVVKAKVVQSKIFPSFLFFIVSPFFWLFFCLTFKIKLINSLPDPPRLSNFLHLAIVCPFLR